VDNLFEPLTVTLSERTVPELKEPLHHNPVIHRVLAARGIEHPDQLNLALAGLPRPDLLPDIEKAVSRLLNALDNSERLLIVGDYDCDGATSTAVAMLGLSMLGFKQLDYLVPNRFEHGYGLSPDIVDVAQERFQPSLILTVDNGVASVEGVDRARALGIDVIVTDHHLPPDDLPDAVAIVNPNLVGSEFPSTHLAGVGVMFYTLIALRAALMKQSIERADASIASLLDLVAVGTVADVVPLDETNRILVEQGLRRIRAGKTRPGIQALLKAAGRDAAKMSTQDIGFGIGPRLNAAGRLDNMSVGIECLLTDDPAAALDLSGQLNSLNEERRSIENSMRQSANEQLDNLSFDDIDATQRFSLCLFDEQWHQGVIGILAGRIKENVHRPVVVFTGDDDEFIKGSARSISGVHVRDVLQLVATRHPNMIHKFGGHAMAAGLTLRKDKLKDFEQSFEKAVRDVSDNVLPIKEYVTDGSLKSTDRTLENALAMAHLMPWGQAFEAPVYSDFFQVQQHKIVGNGHLKLLLKSWAENDARPIDAIAFNCALALDSQKPVFAVYSLDANTWRDRQSVQLRVIHLEQAALR